MRLWTKIYVWLARSELHRAPCDSNSNFGTQAGQGRAGQGSRHLSCSGPPSSLLSGNLEILHRRVDQHDCAGQVVSQVPLLYYRISWLAVGCSAVHWLYMIHWIPESLALIVGWFSSLLSPLSSYLSYISLWCFTSILLFTHLLDLLWINCTL